MKKSIFTLFAGQSGGAQKTGSPATKDNQATIQDGSENGVRRQLLQMLTRDLLRRHGIPPHWIDSQMMVVSSRTRGPGMYLRLVMRHWDERLMNHTSAFQTTLLNDIKQFEPNAGQWLHGISWQLEFDDNCPYTTLPSGNFWLEPTEKPNPSRGPQQPAPNGARQETRASLAVLESQFAAGDQQASSHTNTTFGAPGYEKTQPSPL